MPVRDIRTRLILDGEREFNKALGEIERESRVLKSEMGKLEAQYDLTGDAQDYYAQKGSVLTRQIEAQEIKVQALEQAVKDAAEAYGDGSRQADGYRIKLNNAEKALANMKKAQNENEKALDDCETAMKEFEDAAGGAMGHGEDATNDLKSTVSAFASSAGGDLGGIVDMVFNIADEMANTAGGIDTSAGGINLSMAGIAAAAAAVIETIAKIGEEMYEQRKKVEVEAVGMEIALGLGAEESKRLTDTGKRIYSEGFAGSFEEAMQDLTVMKAYMRDLDDTTLEKVTKQAATLAATTSADMEAIAKAASVMQSEFGGSVEQTMNIIAAAVQANPLEAGELMDAFKEYSVQFAQMGASAEETAGILSTSLENGVWSVDKVGDAFKELNIRAKDGSDSTKEALQELRLPAEATMKAIANGGDGAWSAVERILTALDRMPNKLKQNEIGVALMGSQWEDVGPKAILQLDGIGDKFTETSGIAEENTNKYRQAVTTGNSEFYSTIEGAAGGTAASIVKIFDNGFLALARNLERNAKIMAEQAERGGDEIGKNIADGAIGGLQGKEDELCRQTESIFEKAWNGVKDFLGIHSPSTLYADLGKYSGQGYIEGMERALKNAEKDIDLIMTPSFEASTTQRQQVQSHLMAGGNIYNITIPAKTVKEFEDIVRIANNERVNRRAGKVR